MNILEFVSKYIGKKVDYDGVYGAQCVDLVRQYIQEVWRIPQPEPTGDLGAIAFYTQHYQRIVQAYNCDRIEYHPGIIPPSGSLVVFNPIPTNQYGHIGICVIASDTVITLFEQDGFKQDGAKIMIWDYKRVAGFLVKKE